MSQEPAKIPSSARSAATPQERNRHGVVAPVSSSGLNKDIVFREPMDQYQSERKQAILDESIDYRNVLFDLFAAVRVADQRQEAELLEMIRNRRSVQHVHAFIDEILASVSPPNQIHGIFTGNERGKEVESDPPRVRSSIMDVRYLCEIAPYRVPAKPWTTVTEDDDLISHLLSLYLTWGYPFYSFFCLETFVKHMRSGELNSDFCSPFLVNALLANACVSVKGRDGKSACVQIIFNTLQYYSDYSEAYALPGDVKTKGANFLAEAEWYLRSHQFESGSDIRLASLQAILLLYERYSMSGKDDFGYTMLHKAIRMAESLGIVNGPKLRLQTGHMTRDMTRSLKRTAWGLFQLDTIVHANFLKPSLIESVNINALDREETPATELWFPYPIPRRPRQSLMSLYFDEACRLSFIAKDTSAKMSCARPDENLKREMYGWLRQWEKELPQSFVPGKSLPPYIMMLWMRYHTLVINLCLHDIDLKFSSANQPARTSNTSDLQNINGDIRAALYSAREIASLVQLYREEYGMEYSHPFAMYAIDVSLFSLLAQEDFDILDPGFLSLTSAFSTIACRSQVGRHLFHAFKLSVRSRNQGDRLLNSVDVPRGMQELFGRRESNPNEPDKWDHYADDLAKADGERSFLEEIGVEPELPGLHDMLKWYERLTIGKESLAQKNGR